MFAIGLAVLLAVIGGVIGYVSRKSVIGAAWGLYLGLMVGWLGGRMIVIVPAAHLGVVYNPLHGGIQLDTVLTEGFHLVSPFVDTRTFNGQTQAYTMSGQKDEGAVVGDDSIQCQTNEGLAANLDLTVNWRVDPKRAAYIWANLGEDYQHTFIRPLVQEAIRMVVAKYSVQGIYSRERQLVQRDIDVETAPILERYGLLLDDVKVRNVDPYTVNPEFRTAVEEKQAAQQEVSTERRNLEKAAFEKATSINDARGECRSIAQRAQALRANPAYIQYQMAQKIGPKVKTIYGPTSLLIGGNAK